MPRSPWLVAIVPKRLKPAANLLHKTAVSTRRRFERLKAKWLPPVKHIPAIPIAKFLAREHEELLGLQRRQYLLEAVATEWPRITRGREYWIHDDAAFRSLGDVDAMNVIDLCSWAIGTLDTDESLLSRVKQHYLADLPVHRKWRSEGESQTIAEVNDQSHAEARARLFPLAIGRALTTADVDRLIAVFNKRTWPLRDDRNKNRAHAHENKTQGSARLLDVAEVREVYRYARRLLNDLSIVALGTTWSETDVNSNNVEFTAEDNLDVVFLPRWFRREMRAQKLTRDEIYHALHSDTGPGHFNDKAKLEALSDQTKNRESKP